MPILNKQTMPLSLANAIYWPQQSHTPITISVISLFLLPNLHNQYICTYTISPAPLSYRNSLNKRKKRSESPQLPTPPLKSKIQRNGHKQRSTKRTRSQLIIIPCRFSSPNSVAPIQIHHDRIQQRQNRQYRKRRGRDERGRPALFRSKVEERHRDGAHVD